MKRHMTLAVAIAAVTMLALPAFAGGNGHKKASANRKKHTRRAVERKNIQGKRIRSGVKDGSLTQREAHGLVSKEQRIGHAAKKAASDGDVTAREKMQLGHMQNKLSRHIFTERHDKQGKMGPNLPATANPGVNRRQRRQRHRIAHGIKNGSLTKDEVKGIVAREKAIAKLEAEMKSDGKLDMKERKTLHTLLNQTSKLIFKAKHDSDVRPLAASARNKNIPGKPNYPAIKKALKQKIVNGQMTHAEAKILLKHIHRVHELKRKLATAKLSPEQRAKLEAELDALVNSIY